MISRVVLAVAGLAIVAAAPVGPSVAQFTALRTAKGEKCPPMRHLSCAALGDPSELKCTYQERFTRAKWTTTNALVGWNGTGWHWLDGGPRCSSLPQH